MNNDLSALSNELKKPKVFIAAIEINNALVPALIYGILQGVKQKILAYGQPALIEDNSQNLLSSNPGISFFYNNPQKLIYEKNINRSAQNTDFGVRIEYDAASDQFLVKQLSEVSQQKTEWRIYGNGITEQSTRQIPHFKKTNEAYQALFCPEKLEIFIKDCADKIIELLKNTIASLEKQDEQCHKTAL